MVPICPSAQTAYRNVPAWDPELLFMEHPECARTEYYSVGVAESIWTARRIWSCFIGLATYITAPNS